MAHKNLFIIDRPEGSVIVRNKKGSLLVAARPGPEGGMLYMTPGQSKAIWTTAERWAGMLEALNVMNAPPTTPTDAQTAAMCVFMTGSK